MYATYPETYGLELLLRLSNHTSSKNGVADVRRSRTRSNSSILQSSGRKLGESELVTYILPDFGAVEYFQKEFAAMSEFHVVEESEALGFEIYLVDQWVRHRKIGTVVSVYTGNYESKVKVVRFTIKKVPTKFYPARFQEYLNETILNHASYKRMNVSDATSAHAFSTKNSVEYLLVTNITALPSNLNLVPIPGGDVRAIRATFAINSNLKKLNCAGRTLALLTERVSAASEDKFRQMYRIFNELVPIGFAVRELVNLIQTSLFYFDLLDVRYCDGLLCQKTEDAINNWWNLIGLPHFNVKPNPRAGILPAKTVASIISLTISVKMRLHLFGGCDTPKDPYDFENFMLSVGQFQKQVKLEKKRKLNLVTLLHLFYYTNQKLPSATKQQQFSAFGSELSLPEGSQTDLSNLASNKHFSSSAYPSRSISNQTASAYRRNKLYYSKELKKLTNAVKNTVQDHIIVREGNEGFYPEPSHKPGAKLRSKIASKLTDLITPNDVETTDLEFLVNKCLVGKTLLRLWQGLGESSEFSVLNLDEKLSLAPHYHHHHHIHRRNGSHEPSSFASDGEDSKYQYICLKDGIMMSRELLTSQNTEKTSGRLGRMKFALQGRRPNHIRDLDKGITDISGFEKLSLSSSEQLDHLLPKLNCPPGKEPCPDLRETVSSKKKKETQNIRGLLNRRGSFPTLFNGAELNIHTVEAIKPTIKPLEGHALRKCASFSAIDDLFFRNHDLDNKEKLKISYVETVMNMMELDQLRKLTKSDQIKVSQSYKRINIDLIKLHSIHNRMVSQQLFINSEYSSVLTGRMKDLTDNIDRMTFRSRDLLKKINELEENSSNFNLKLQEACIQKLGILVDSLVNSNKFKDVFKDEEERRKIVLELGGTENTTCDENDTEKTYWGLRLAVIFVYELIVFFLQLLNFDRSKMNLDRIRQSYSMVDPSRRYIDGAYTFVRRDSLTMRSPSVSVDTVNTQDGEESK